MLQSIKNAFRRGERSTDASRNAAPATIAPEATDAPVMMGETEASFLWLDRSQTDDEIRRRVARGLVTPDEARLLEHWSASGYVILENCISPDLVDEALADVDRAWRDERPLSIDVLTTGERTTIAEAGAGARAVPYKLNDFYLQSEAVRRIFLDERIVRFGELVFDDEVVGCNSLTFEYSTQQPAHVDHVYMTPTPPRRLVAAWVACEDILPESGPLEYWVGSHRLAPFDFGGYHYTPEQDARHTAYVAAEKERFPKREFLARKGDVLIWHAMLIHGGGAIRRDGLTRKSMAFHYYSREVVGRSRSGLASHGRAHYMTKGVAQENS
jgi:ectoine hydroxylase-related dioxygenase (phytanoyl-CoA dioxygenase family)